ncbi:hypothetical protein BDK51DRAFT_39178 [Blyttiomyces helicus]|uniref:Uncharacterized protein n=1 Tax=Blyttiomyces helicus TaxID=388810 RepID=A0A4P9VVK6_9FUNG|nr:hypothetical protein BDK51DRAFT_39178 [Blyttiomyces helicus]|eukprot:RKO83689.1 hypothetical protein BDK51DRAFT_39178 [Blyttiomyces helicus]
MKGISPAVHRWPRPHPIHTLAAYRLLSPPRPEPLAGPIKMVVGVLQIRPDASFDDSGKDPPPLDRAMDDPPAARPYRSLAYFGKLTAISGIGFPRGTGTVTRCATELRMKECAVGSPFSARVFTSEDDGSRVTLDSPKELALFIEKKTLELCGRRTT